MKRSPLRHKVMPQDERDHRDRVRAEVFARDVMCRLYGTDCNGPLTPHHLRKASQGGTYEPSNLVALCAHHNRWVEDHPVYAHELGLVVRAGEDVQRAYDAMRRAHIGRRSDP